MMLFLALDLLALSKMERRKVGELFDLLKTISKDDFVEWFKSDGMEFIAKKSHDTYHISIPRLLLKRTCGRAHSTLCGKFFEAIGLYKRKAHFGRLSNQAIVLSGIPDTKYSNRACPDIPAAHSAFLNAVHKAWEAYQALSRWCC
jgi:hypothetical protein